MLKKIFTAAFVFSCWYLLSVVGSGCAQIGYPTGGDRDTLAPVLVKASPVERKLLFSGNKITLTFNEFVDVQELQNNLLVSPLPKQNPTVSYNLKTVTIKLRDTLKPNTTYTLNFGNAIKDVNEGNILKNFRYVFSTGESIDSLTLGGKITLAQSGKTDSSMLVMLYRNLADTAVEKERPDYIAKLKGNGSFYFENLPAGTYHIFGLKDNDGGKTYNSKSELFAFSNEPVIIAANTKPVTLYAYALEKPSGPLKTSGTQPPPRRLITDKRLKYSSSLLASKQQDILQPFQLNFTNRIVKLDSTKISITDTNYKPIAAVFSIDSTRKKINLAVNWQPANDYFLLIGEGALEDSLGLKQEKNDSIRFKTLRTEDYGSVQLRFSGLNLAKNPVLQFVQNDEIKNSYPITSAQWENKLFVPGDYEIRILYDENKNGIWDPGNYTLKKQPEKAVSFPQVFSVKANWENEQDIKLE
ncbi:MAG: Ig-like domain-containing protein [Ferruginibacter sp.]